MYPYQIRLRGPWDYELDPSTALAHPTLAPSGRITMPCRLADTGLRGFSGSISLRRRFGLPRRLDGHEHVWLVFADVEGIMVAKLNQNLLGRHQGPGPFSAEVGSLLKERNELVVDLTVENDRGGLVGETALEIRCSAFLEDLHAERTPDGAIHVTGQLVGESAAPLDFYLLAADRTIGYCKLPAFQGRRAIEIISDQETEESSRTTIVRLELVQGAVVWFSADTEIS